MQPQGTAVTNPKYFTQMTAAINGVNSGAELQTLTNTIMLSLKADTSAITDQMAKISPILALLTPPTTPAALITWAGNVITYIFTPMYKPYITYGIQMAALLVAIANLTAAITAKQAQFPSCSISIPTVP